MQDPSPTECQYTDDDGNKCENAPIVGVNDTYVCKEHVQWAFDKYLKPSDIQELLSGYHG